MKLINKVRTLFPALNQRIMLSAMSYMLWSFCLTQAPGADRHDVLIVVGAAGTDVFDKRFNAWADTWLEACAHAQVGHELIGLTAPDQQQATDKELLQQALTKNNTASVNPLWIVLIGHGTYDGQSAKFNLRGPDVASTDLSSWLVNYQRPVVLINTAPASAPFLQAVSFPGRVIISATKSGTEANATRFGGFFAQALASAHKPSNDISADIDHDGQISVLELFLSAAHAVANSYEKDGLIATEHPLIDDNGDGRGTRADWFDGVWAKKSAADGASVDGIRAHQIHLLPSKEELALSDNDRQERDQLELRLAELRAEKNKLSEQDYYQKLEKIMVQLAKIYSRSQQPAPQQAPASQQAPDSQEQKAPPVP